MTPQEKLKEIKTETDRRTISMETTKWLIARVEQLEEALDQVQGNRLLSYGLIEALARKALETMP